MTLRIFLYDGSKSDVLYIHEIKGYLKEKLERVDIVVRGDFLAHHLKKDEIDNLARTFASLRVIDLTKPFQSNEPSYGEIQYEKRVLKNLTMPHGILYDGFRLHRIFGRLLPKEERGLENVHIILTDRLFGTFDKDDLRYHARVIICGYPSIISTTGVVEAPAKPREFYIEKQLTGVGDDLAIERLKQRFKGRFIDYNDKRLSEVMKGYVMQAVFYHVFHEAFCKDKRCRLYNAHWQEEVINAQLTKPEFCEKHEKMLAKIL